MIWGSSNLPLWIAEDATWLILWGILVGGILLFAWFMARQNVLLVLFLLTVIGIGVVVYVEQQVVTDNEYLVNAVHDMAKAVRANNVEGIVQYIHTDNQQLKDKVYMDVGRYVVDSCTIIGFNKKEVDLESNPPTGKIGFAVWGTGRLSRRENSPFSANVVVELDFKKKNDVWGLVGYRYRPSNSTSWYGKSH